MTSRKSNMAASVRQRLLNRARERREDFGLLLTRFGTERLLYRLGESEFGGAFILKGAMLFPLWGMDEHRPTRFRDVCRVAVEDDGLRFDPQSVKADAIREEMEYELRSSLWVVGCRTDTELARALGTSSSTISTWKARQAIPYELVARVAEERHVPFTWFFAEESSSGDQAGASGAPVLLLSRIPDELPGDLRPEHVCHQGDSRFRAAADHPLFPSSKGSYPRGKGARMPRPARAFLPQHQHPPGIFHPERRWADLAPPPRGRSVPPPSPS